MLQRREQRGRISELRILRICLRLLSDSHRQRLIEVSEIIAVLVDEVTLYSNKSLLEFIQNPVIAIPTATDEDWWNSFQQELKGGGVI